jgi:hypothetical protein
MLEDGGENFLIILSISLVKKLRAFPATLKRLVSAFFRSSFLLDAYQQQSVSYIYDVAEVNERAHLANKFLVIPIVIN